MAEEDTDFCYTGIKRLENIIGLGIGAALIVSGQMFDYHSVDNLVELAGAGIIAGQIFSVVGRYRMSKHYYIAEKREN